jgi:hypothetical protein
MHLHLANETNDCDLTQLRVPRIQQGMGFFYKNGTFCNPIGRQFKMIFVHWHLYQYWHTTYLWFCAFLKETLKTLAKKNLAFII